MSVERRNVHGNSPRRKVFRHVMKQLSAKLTGRDSCNAHRGKILRHERSGIFCCGSLEVNGYIFLTGS